MTENMHPYVRTVASSVPTGQKEFLFAGGKPGMALSQWPIATLEEGKSQNPFHFDSCSTVTLKEACPFHPNCNLAALCEECTVLVCR